jgi:1-phosphofructokinase family hexose kinase
VILAAGLSPAWQQIVVLEALAVGEVNRASEVHWCASGKVLNVGSALRGLADVGGESLTLASIGGSVGGAVRREFDARGIPARWIEATALTRVCTTILDRSTGRTTELVENAGAISADELDQFKTAFCEEARRAGVVVLSGSFPPGVPATLYAELLAETQGKVVLDAQGEPLLAALSGRPHVVKPNREELARTLARTLVTDDDLHAAMRELCRRGAEWVVVTQGTGPVWVGSERELFSLNSLQVPLVNPIGSGDCLAAGIAAALAKGDDVPRAVEFGIAAAAENVQHLLPARLDVERVIALAGQVKR